MKNLLALGSLTLLLPACGNITSDFSLFLGSPEVVTEYYVQSGSKRISVACDRVDGTPQATTIRQYFTFSGTLKSLSMELVGQNSGESDDFSRVFTKDEIRPDENSDDRYYVSFESELNTRPTPLSNEGSVSAQGIVVSPVFNRQAVYLRGTSPAGAFFARAYGISESNERTGTIRSANVNVYANCYTSP